MRFLKVAVPVPALGLLTYQASDADRVCVGARVVVPLGSRAVTGVVVETDAPASEVGREAVKPVQRILDRDPLVPSDVVELARWTSDYYAAGAGETLTAVLPPMARGQRVDTHRTRRVARITAAGLDDRARTAKQREALTLLASTPAGLPTSTLAKRGFGAPMLRRLALQGLVRLDEERVERDPFPTAVTAASSNAGRPLTREQRDALLRLGGLADSRTFRVALLHGVTGSGKTEVYLRLSTTVCSAGRTVLVLVPEIALTPAMGALFQQTFSTRIAIQHSGLSAGERHDQWQRIRRGDVDVVIGTRSAVFAPLERLGLVIVDEEHDSSYKQEESPRYNGRDVAIVRGQRAGALVVLGSATPSLESYHNAICGKYERIVLERRVHDRELPSVIVVDMREEFAASGPDVVLSRALSARIAERLERAEQSLILLNRRGFATAIFCRQCAGTMECPNCSVSLVVHGEGPSRRVRCHYCNYSCKVPPACPSCKAPYLEQAGYGTERIEREIGTAFPHARVARLDRDSVRKKGSLASLLSRFREGAIDVLVGTQMIAKGHDFPRVTLVGVVSADVGLGMPDFRASERTFQLLTQVAGRAGRGDRRGEAVVQTLYPDHYSIQLACRQDYTSFFEREIAFRRAMKYPPVAALINVVIRARTWATAIDDASHFAERVRRSPDAPHDLRVLGPAPAPLGRLRGEYRVQVLIKGRSRQRVRQAVLAALAGRRELQRRVLVDVDPLSVL